MRVQFDLIQVPEMPAVGQIADNWAADMGQLRPNLVESSGGGMHFQQGRFAGSFQGTVTQSGQLRAAPL